MILMGEVVALGVKDGKKQRGMRLFHSVLSVRNICENIMSVYQKDIFDRMYRCHQNLYDIITL